MTNEELITYYVDLLIRQFHTMPKARATVDAFVAEVVADQIVRQVVNAFDVDTAVGAQLDIIGKYVGVNRRVNGLDITREYFAMPGYEDASPDTYKGFADYDDSPSPDWFFRVYADENSAYAMTDDEMRSLIKMKIRQNNSNHSLADIDDIIDEFFGADCLVTDGGDMTLTYAFTPGLTYNLPAIAAFTKVLPHPAGVEIIITGL